MPDTHSDNAREKGDCHLQAFYKSCYAELIRRPVRRRHAWHAKYPHEMIRQADEDRSLQKPAREGARYGKDKEMEQ